MQTVETLNEGLKRAYKLTITSQDIDGRVDAELKRVAPTIKMPGFRPGKVPANLVRKMHGPALMQEALNTSIQQGVQALLAEHRLRPAIQPSVELDDGYELGSDAEVKVALEVLPDVPTPAIDALVLERLTVPVDDARIDEQLNELAGQQKAYEPAPEGHAAETGDLVVMNFLGKVDGVPFEGGAGDDMSIEIGSGRLIPGFEDQLIGVSGGDEKTIEVTFPEDYTVDTLKGKPATFELTINEVRRPVTTVVDDDFAKTLGLEGLEQLRGLLKGQLEQELNGLTRTHMKRKLLDQLAAGHDFEVPPSMVEAEFAQIWQQLEHEAKHEADPEAALAEMEGERADYRAIAERRVRLGLLLSEIGQANGVNVTQTEMNRLVAQAAQQYKPEDRQRFAEYVAQDAVAAAQIRAPLYEDKVVDLLFGKATITDREVTREVLEAAIESEEGGPNAKPAEEAAATDASVAEAAPVEAPVKKARKAKAKPAAEAADETVPAEPVAEVEAVEAAKAKPVKKAAAKKPAAKKPAVEKSED